jgi:hypothetical protein
MLRGKKMISRIVNNFRQNKFIYMIISVSVLIIILILRHIIWKLGIFSLGSVACLSSIILIVIHYSIDKFNLQQSNNTHLVVWLGLISTFIGFTLSSYYAQTQMEQNEKQAQQQQEKYDKQRLKGYLDMTEDILNLRIEVAHNTLSEHLTYYYQENIKLQSFLPVNMPIDTISNIQENGEFIKYLSEEFVEDILFNSDFQTGINAERWEGHLDKVRQELVQKGTYSEENKEHLYQVRLYHLFIIQNKYLKERIALEKEFIDNKFPKVINKEKQLTFKQELTDLKHKKTKAQDYIQNNSTDVIYSQMSHFDSIEDYYWFIEDNVKPPR